MPELDGFDVAERISGSPGLTPPTIMMLTSSGQHGDAGRCKELGISAYLTKPVEGLDLHDAICRALGTRQRKSESASARAKVQTGVALRILLAEDNIVNQRVAVGLLTRRGHHVTVANHGREALAALNWERFDLALMDIQMPEMGGFEATAAIRRREREQGLPPLRIIAMTAHAMTGDRERCLEAGMDGYLSKPIDTALLFSTVENHPRVEDGEEAVIPPTAPAAVNCDVLMNRLANDEELFHQVIELFLADCPPRLTAIETAVTAGDADQIRFAAHALKGSAGNLAAEGLFEAARALERMAAESRLDEAAAGLRKVLEQAAAVMTQLRELQAAGQGVR
jgi:CheY-like chemotaxis protein